MHHFQTKLVYYLECFYRTLWQPYWCSKTMKRWPCWCTKMILWASDSFLMQTLFFVPINLHRCWSHDLNRSITEHIIRDCKNEWCLYSSNQNLTSIHQLDNPFIFCTSSKYQLYTNNPVSSKHPCTVVIYIISPSPGGHQNEQLGLKKDTTYTNNYFSNYLLFNC